MARQIKVSCGTCRHPQDIPLAHVAEIDSHSDLAELVSLKLKPRHWIKDTWGDGQYHGWVIADRVAVAALLRFAHN